MAETDNRFLDYDGVEVLTEVYDARYAATGDIPDVPVKGVKHGDTALVPDSNGVVTVPQGEMNTITGATLGDAAVSIEEKTLKFPAYPAVPVKGVKSGDTALVPDTDGIVTVPAPVIPVKGVKTGDSAVTPDADGIVALGTAAAASTAAAVADDATLPTGAAVKAFVEGKGYLVESDVTTLIGNAGHTTMEAVEAKGYLNETQVAAKVESYGYATETYVAQQVANASHLKKEVVDELPAIGDADTDTIYLVPNGGSAPNVKDEYMVLNGSFELLGTTATDLTGYATETYVDTAVAGMATQTWVNEQGFALAANVPQPLTPAQIRAAVAAADAVSGE